MAFLEHYKEEIRKVWTESPDESRLVKLAASVLMAGLVFVERHEEKVLNKARGILATELPWESATLDSRSVNALFAPHDKVELTDAELEVWKKYVDEP